MGSQGVMLGQRKRWRRVSPSGAFAIDWNHPLARGLTLLWLPGLSEIPQYGVTGSPVYGAYYAAGRGTRWGSSSDRRHYVLVGASSSLASGTFAWPASLAVVRRTLPNGAPGAGCPVGLLANITDAAPYNGMAFIGSGATGTGSYLGCGDGSGGTSALAISSTENFQGDHVHVGTATTTTQRVYVDGVLDGTGAVTIANPVMASPNVTLDFNAAQTARYMYSTHSLMAMWNRELTAYEVAEFSADPFCFLRY